MKTRSSREVFMDRLSQLPDSIIFHIFWLMPMTDVVRTTFLSKRWKNLWTTAPYLNFYDTDEEDDATELRNFVNRALLRRWNGVRVLKLKVESFYELDDSINADTDLWVRFAKNNQAEELYLHMELLDYDRMQCNDWVPQCLYSCSSLKVLSMKYCEFRIKGNVQWNQLKSLTIIDGFGVTEDAINRILCGSPRLEVLIMSVVESGFTLCIRSTSLKELSIYNHIFDICVNTCPTELRIWTPNLKTLKIEGSPYDKCLLMNVSSLNHATFSYSGLHRTDTCCEGFSGMDDFLSTDHFLGDLFGQILPSIQHVENVTLLPCCLQVLGAMIEGCMNSSSPNVKLLRFRFYCDEVAVTIVIFPLSQKLVIKVEERARYEDSIWADPFNYREFEENLPMLFVLQLRTVEYNLVEGDIIFPCLEFLLKNASRLEKIVFRVKGSMRHSRRLESLFRASQKLLKIPRSSRTAEFTFCEY
ncbi:F-box/LRR-repeat protein At3g26922-like [Salvia miltiorrhiza]|uniref:F-box/LRR-repeat protein At3g26922-like n=1 Tax=Salvia miltiorrhiza TaxID=226208 RepID=UPI0025AD5238|nr:F-box/LRR-repeat protein At3g26922-like [Salvia miltiorrhiza]